MAKETAASFQKTASAGHSYRRRNDAGLFKGDQRVDPLEHLRAASHRHSRDSHERKTGCRLRGPGMVPRFQLFPVRQNGGHSAAPAPDDNRVWYRLHADCLLGYMATAAVGQGIENDG